MNKKELEKLVKVLQKNLADLACMISNLPDETKESPAALTEPEQTKTKADSKADTRETLKAEKLDPKEEFRHSLSQYENDILRTVFERRRISHISQIRVEDYPRILDDIAALTGEEVNHEQLVH